MEWLLEHKEIFLYIFLVSIGLLVLDIAREVLWDWYKWWKHERDNTRCGKVGEE